jgi:acyl-CoA thioesterase I
MKRGLPLAVVIAAVGLLMVLCPMHTIEAEPRAPVIVAFGDSLTAGFGLPQGETFPVQLEAALKARGASVGVVNAGVSGDTAGAALKRLDWALPQDASAVIIELGGNDALEGIPTEAIKTSLEKIIEAVQAKGLPILLAGMEAPRNMGKDYVTAFAAIYTDLAARHGLVLYPFFLDGVVLDDSLMQGDGIHPNAKGVARIVELIIPKVEELLAKVKAKD